MIGAIFVWFDPFYAVAVPGSTSSGFTLPKTFEYTGYIYLICAAQFLPW